MGDQIGGHAIEPVSRLPELVAERDVAIGVIATPAAAAQDVADQLVAAGITSILNFAPAVLSVPEGVSLRKVDLAVELQILSFYQQREIVTSYPVNLLLAGLPVLVVGGGRGRPGEGSGLARRWCCGDGGRA